MAIRWLWITAAALAGSAVVWADGTINDSPITRHQWTTHPLASWQLQQGNNPNVVQLVLPPVQPLSAVAELGRKLFFDPRLSGSGKLSCASCHSPQHAYAPANDLSVQLGGADMNHAGVRAVPTLTYLYRQQNFSIGPNNEENESVSLQQLVVLGRQTLRTQKSATNTQVTAANLVPQGGLFWDGRVNTLQQQAAGPLFNPLEMDAGSPAKLVFKLKTATYSNDFLKLFGKNVFRAQQLTMAEALFALSRFQIEDPSFHPFTSKYDAWLQGRARFTPIELRGYLAFNNPKKGNCAACHLDLPSRDHLPPLFTDTQYEALGVPRNPALPANRDPNYFDLGLCGPYRTDLKNQSQYCGMFLTPSLRNVATRHAFFHNGIYHTLQQVLDFYNFRDINPHKIYPAAQHGRVDKFNDMPASERANVDISDPPFNRKPGDGPVLNSQDVQAIIAFLQTLNDGYAATELSIKK